MRLIAFLTLCGGGCYFGEIRDEFSHSILVDLLCSSFSVLFLFFGGIYFGEIMPLVLVDFRYLSFWWTYRSYSDGTLPVLFW